MGENEIAVSSSERWSVVERLMIFWKRKGGERAR